MVCSSSDSEGRSLKVLSSRPGASREKRRTRWGRGPPAPSGSSAAAAGGCGSPGPSAPVESVTAGFSETPPLFWFTSASPPRPAHKQTRGHLWPRGGGGGRGEGGREVGMERGDAWMDGCMDGWWWCVCVCGGAAWHTTRRTRMTQWSLLSVRVLVPLQRCTEALSLLQLHSTPPGKGATLHTVCSALRLSFATSLNISPHGS